MWYKTVDEEEREMKLFNKAVKLKYSELPADMKELFYSSSFNSNNGYFNDIGELVDGCKEGKKDIPKYVWATRKTMISINAFNIVEEACYELHEDAFDSVDNIEELQAMLDEWCKKQVGTISYSVDYNYAIILEDI